MKFLYKSRQAIIKLFKDYFSIVSEVKYEIKYGEGIKILTPKQILQRLPIAFAQVKTRITSQNLINQIRQIICSCNNIMNSVNT